MTETKQKWMIVELDWTEWSNMLRDFGCPTPSCKKKLTRKTNPEGHIKLACEDCKTYFEPTKKREKVKERDVSLRTKEAAAQRSGGSLYPPLPIYYYCEGCHELALKRIEHRNRFEQEANIQLTLPKGDEGYTSTLVQQHLLLPLALNEEFPFTCACGKRYSANVKLIQRDRTKHPLFAIEMGFHNNCMACKYVFEQATARDSFQFRCDKNTDCEHIQKLKEKEPDRIWIIEEGL